MGKKNRGYIQTKEINLSECTTMQRAKAAIAHLKTNKPYDIHFYKMGTCENACEPAVKQLCKNLASTASCASAPYQGVKQVGKH